MPEAVRLARCQNSHFCIWMRFSILPAIPLTANRPMEPVHGQDYLPNTARIGIVVAGSVSGKAVSGDGSGVAGFVHRRQRLAIAGP